MRAGWVAAFVLCSLAVTGHAEEAVVGNVGLRSVDVPTLGLAPLEAALDRALSIHAPAVRGKTATLGLLGADSEISGRRAEARRAADAGSNAMRQLELDKALEEFDRAVALFIAAHGDRIEPAEVARIFTTRAKLAQMQRSNSSLEAELERALPLHPTKLLDPNTFPPETIALFQQVSADAAKQPLQPPATAPLLDIARRTGLRWIVAGEARRVDTGHRVSLVLVDASGTARTTDFLVPPDGAAQVFEGAVLKLVRDAGVLVRGGEVAAATPSPTGPPRLGVTATGSSALATATPVPKSDLLRPPVAPRKKAATAAPLHRKWYFIAGAVVVVAAGAGLAASAGGDGGGGNGSSNPPPDSGVTLVIERP